MPALKWRPVDARTTTRASPVESILRIRFGSSLQNAGVMVFSWSGRFKVTVATPSATSVSKQV